MWKLQLMPKLQETTGFSSSKLPLLKEASQAGPFLEQQVITGGSVSQSLVSQWPWDGSVSQQAAAPLFSKQAQSSQLWSVLVQLCAEWYASPPSRAYYLRSGLILILVFFFFFLLDWINWAWREGRIVWKEAKCITLLLLLCFLVLLAFMY